LFNLRSSAVYTQPAFEAELDAFIARGLLEFGVQGSVCLHMKMDPSLAAQRASNLGHCFVDRTDAFLKAHASSKFKCNCKFVFFLCDRYSPFDVAKMITDGQASCLILDKKRLRGKVSIQGIVTNGPVEFIGKEINNEILVGCGWDGSGCKARHEFCLEIGLVLKFQKNGDVIVNPSPSIGKLVAYEATSTEALLNRDTIDILQKQMARHGVIASSAP